MEFFFLYLGVLSAFLAGLYADESKWVGYVLLGCSVISAFIVSAHMLRVYW